ncbi:hypothetical protein BGX28_009362 [Mortierella sp. GBA30]|nr:hypothetical protein BGX28_009362 [Mortierella sp. GBA30]
MPKLVQVHLSLGQKHQIREYKAQHPEVTQSSLAFWAQSQFNLDKPPSQQSISLVFTTERSDIPKVPRINLTSEEKRQIFEHKLQHPTKTLRAMALWAYSSLNLDKQPSETCIQRIIKSAACGLTRTYAQLTIEQRQQIREQHARRPTKTLHSLALWSQRRFKLTNPPSTKHIRTILATSPGCDVPNKPRSNFTADEERQITAHKAQNPTMTMLSLAMWAQKVFNLDQPPSVQGISLVLANPRFGLPKHSRVYLTADEKRQICEKKAHNPTTTTLTLARWAQKKFNLDKLPSLAGISLILAQAKGGILQHFRAHLTADEKRQVCEGKGQDPTITSSALALQAQKKFSLDKPPSQESIALILKKAEAHISKPTSRSEFDEKKLDGHCEVALGFTSRRSRWSDCSSSVLERTIVYFIVNQTILRGINPTSDDTMDKGRQFARALGLSRKDASLSHTWFNSFHKRHGLTASIANWSEDSSVLEKLRAKELSDQELLHIASEACTVDDIPEDYNAVSESVYLDANGMSESECEGDVDSKSIGMDTDADTDMDMDIAAFEDDDQEEKGDDRQEAKQEAEQDDDMPIGTRDTGESSSLALEEKVRALFVVIPLLDPSASQQQEAYDVLYRLYLRLKTPELKQEPIEATMDTWTREKHDSLLIVMGLLDLSVESHRSTYAVLSQEREKLTYEQ